MELERVGLTKDRFTEIADHLSLSPRERVVASQVLRGRSRKRIAADLGISVSTVTTHLRRTMWKAGVESIPSLILRIIQVRDLCASHDDDSPAASETKGVHR